MRKNWKKALTLVMAAAMAAGLAGCGKADRGDNGGTDRGCQDRGGSNGG